MLAVLLPVGFVLAYMAIPAPIPDSLVTAPQIVSAHMTDFQPVEGRTATNDWFSAQYLNSTDSLRPASIELTVLKPLPRPAVWVRLGDGETGPLLGALHEKGVYSFELTAEWAEKATCELHFSDPIKMEADIFPTIRL